MNEPLQLPALIDRARQRLAEARTSAEVLEAKAVAQAALHYAKLTHAANETHADCLRMIVRAEMRMADEIDRKPTAQGKRTDIVANADEVPTIEELGIRRDQVQEWREIRDAGEAVVERAISQALQENRAPTKTDIRRAIEPPSLEPSGSQFMCRECGQTMSRVLRTEFDGVDVMRCRRCEVCFRKYWTRESWVRNAPAAKISTHIGVS